jgi:hypothetical protein
MRQALQDFKLEFDIFLHKTCLTTFLKTWMSRFSLKIYFSAKTKVVQLVKHNNFLRYSSLRFPQKTLPDLTVSAQILVCRYIRF